MCYNLRNEKKSFYNEISIYGSATSDFIPNRKSPQGEECSRFDFTAIRKDGNTDTIPVVIINNLLSKLIANKYESFRLDGLISTVSTYILTETGEPLRRDKDLGLVTQNNKVIVPQCETPSKFDKAKKVVLDYGIIKPNHFTRIIAQDITFDDSDPYLNEVYLQGRLCWKDPNGFRYTHNNQKRLDFKVAYGNSYIPVISIANAAKKVDALPMKNIISLDNVRIQSRQYQKKDKNSMSSRVELFIDNEEKLHSY